MVSLMRTREDEAGMGVSLSASVSDNGPEKTFMSVIIWQHIVLGVPKIVFGFFTRIARSVSGLFRDVQQVFI